MDNAEMRRNDIINTCRRLRKNQTYAEQKLWSLLRNRQLSGVKFKRQFPADEYILDFYCPEYKLGIEADGGQHYEEKGRKDDNLRNRELAGLEIEIIRFSNLEILSNINGVYETIQRIIENKKSSHPSP